MEGAKIKLCKLLVVAILLFLCACSTPVPDIPTGVSTTDPVDVEATQFPEDGVEPDNESLDLSYRLELEPAEIAREWKGYLTKYFDNTPVPTIRITDSNPSGLYAITTYDLGNYTTDNNYSGVPEFYAEQWLGKRWFEFSIGAYGFNLPDTVTGASLIIGNSEIIFSNAMVSSNYSAGPNGADGTFICIQLTDEYGDLSKDKADQMQAAFAESNSCKVVYHGSSGTDYTVTLSDLQVENLRHVLNVFSELLTYYYQ